MKFDTLKEAEEVNSYCVLCGKLKFTHRVTHPENGKPYYTLERCKNQDCQLHCLGNHPPRKIFIDNGCEDHVGMVS